MENNKLPKGGVFDKAIKNHRAIDEITNLLLATNKIKRKIISNELHLAAHFLA